MQRCFYSSGKRPLRRFYHSYPDPDETPKITNTTANSVRRIDKTKLDLKLSKNYSFNQPFKLNQTSGDISSNPNPQSNHRTVCSTLSNGLRVASEDRPSLMASFAMVVKTGR